MTSLYEQDFHEWLLDQANLLKAGRMHLLDIENLVEEIHALARNEKRVLEDAMRDALICLSTLQWSGKCDKREGGLVHVQQQIQGILKDSPSLRQNLDQVLVDAWSFAGIELDLDLPATCPFSLSDVLGDIAG